MGGGGTGGLRARKRGYCLLHAALEISSPRRKEEQLRITIREAEEKHTTAAGAGAGAGAAAGAYQPPPRGEGAGAGASLPPSNGDADGPDRRLLLLQDGPCFFSFCKRTRRPKYIRPMDCNGPNISSKRERRRNKSRRRWGWVVVIFLPAETSEVSRVASRRFPQFLLPTRPPRFLLLLLQAAAAARRRATGDPWSPNRSIQSTSQIPREKELDRRPGRRPWTAPPTGAPRRGPTLPPSLPPVASTLTPPLPPEATGAPSSSPRREAGSSIRCTSIGPSSFASLPFPPSPTRCNFNSFAFDSIRTHMPPSPCS